MQILHRTSVLLRAMKDILVRNVHINVIAVTKLAIKLEGGVLQKDVSEDGRAIRAVKNVQLVTMALIVQTVVEHATILYVSDLKEIAHMDVLKASKDTSVLSQ